MEDHVYIILSFAAIGVLFMVLGLPLKQGAIPPNRWYGFRTRKTLADEEIWYKVNRIAGIDMIRGGAALTAAALVLLALRKTLTLEIAAAILVIVMLAVVIWMAIHGFSRLKEM